MKKSLLFALALAIAVCLSSCGQPQTGTQSQVDSSSASSSISDSSASSSDAGDSSQGSHSLPDQSADISTQIPEADQSANGASSSTASSSEQTEEPNGASDVSTAPQVPAPDSSSTSGTEPEITTPSAPAGEPETDPEPDENQDTTSSGASSLSGTELTLRFGGGETFTIHLYDNDTAAKIAEYVGTAAWQLPIYHFDDYDGWESFQYYDIPRRYDIPSNAQTVTSEKAGAVYYSHPNRIILFYQDANISSEYTPVGYVDFSQDLVDAVESNPVVEGWGNKLIHIST